MKLSHNETNMKSIYQLCKEKGLTTKQLFQEINKPFKFLKESEWHNMFRKNMFSNKVADKICKILEVGLLDIDIHIEVVMKKPKQYVQKMHILQQKADFSKVSGLEKPGAKPKKKPKTRQIKIHDIEKPKDLACKNCGVETETECYHHSESTRIKMLVGGGIMGDKINNHLTAWLCNGLLCGIKFDIKPDKNSHPLLIAEHDLFTYDCIAKTWLNID
jgi:hypothetical protein